MKTDIYLGDCVNIARQHIPDESVELVFADPPFNVGKKYGNGHDDKRTDYYEWCAEWIDECFRVLKPTGTLYLMTISRHLGKIYRLLDNRGVFVSHVNWKNGTSSNSGRCFREYSQPIVVFAKTNDYIFNLRAQNKEVEVPSWSKSRRERSVGQVSDHWDDIPPVYSGSIVHPEAILVPGSGKKVHPAQMPIGLIERPVLFSTNELGVVWEPFGGLCAGAVACIKHNRNYIASEQNEEYVRIAEKRASEAQGMAKRARGEPSPLPLSDSITQMDLFS